MKFEWPALGKSTSGLPNRQNKLVLCKFPISFDTISHLLIYMYFTAKHY